MQLQHATSATNIQMIKQAFNIHLLNNAKEMQSSQLAKLLQTAPHPNLGQQLDVTV